MSRLLSFTALFACLAQFVHANSFVVEFAVQLESGVERFELTVHPDWAPNGAARFRELVDINFFDGIRFFRTISGFMTQWGIPGKPEVAAQWRDKKIPDDPVVGSNKRGFVSFATSGKDSRTTQMFINLVDNANLGRIAVVCPCFTNPRTQCNLSRLHGLFTLRRGHEGHGNC